MTALDPTRVETPAERAERIDVAYSVALGTLGELSNMLEDVLRMDRDVALHVSLDLAHGDFDPFGRPTSRLDRDDANALLLTASTVRSLLCGLLTLPHRRPGNEVA